jgi:hypothetical protein
MKDEAGRQKDKTREDESKDDRNDESVALQKSGDSKKVWRAKMSSSSFIARIHVASLSS